MYKINYIGGADKEYICPITGKKFTGSNMTTSGFRAHLFDNGYDYGNTRRTRSFFSGSTLFVQLELNHIGMINKIENIRKTLKDKLSKDSKLIDKFHITLLKIDFNKNHPQWNKIKQKIDSFIEMINLIFLNVFNNGAFEIASFSRFSKYIALDLKIPDQIAQKYNEAKFKVKKYLDSILGMSEEIDSNYTNPGGKLIEGKRYFIDEKPFYFISNFYITDVLFSPHISILEILDFQEDDQVFLDNLSHILPSTYDFYFKKNQPPLNPIITVDNEFNVKTTLSSYDSNSHLFVTSNEKTSYYANNKQLLIYSCNS